MIPTNFLGLTTEEKEKAKSIIGTIDQYELSVFEVIDTIRGFMELESAKTEMFKGCMVLTMPNKNNAHELLIQRVIA